MSVPTHRPDCETHIWRTTCPDCKKSVYFFSCSCGSRVFFDRKGPPWPMHAESCTIYQIRLMLQEGSTPDRIRRLLHTRVNETGIPLPVEGQEFLRQKEEEYRQSKPEIQVCLPADQPIEFTGRIQNINRQVNFFKRFDFQENLITRKLLGGLVKTPYAEATVREINAMGRSILREATFFLTIESCDALRLRQNQIVTIRLCAQVIAGNDEEAIWLLEEIN
jgi:hypothetical protein